MESVYVYHTFILYNLCHPFFATNILIQQNINVTRFGDNLCLLASIWQRYLQTSVALA
jgi:hypothetical protein